MKGERLRVSFRCSLWPVPVPAPVSAAESVHEGRPKQILDIAAFTSDKSTLTTSVHTFFNSIEPIHPQCTQ